MTSFSSEILRILLVDSKPSMTGITKSIRMRSGRSSIALTSPSCPFVASLTRKPKGAKRLTTTARFSHLSSTTNTCLVSPFTPMIGRKSRSGETKSVSFSGSGKENEKVLPWAGILFTVKLPPIKATNLFVIANPSPVPSACRLRSPT